MYDIAVIGAGVVGSLIARELSKYDLSIAVLEAGNDVAVGTSKANSGIVHAGYDASEGTMKAAMNVPGARMMKTLTAELGVPYRQNGSLVIAFDESELDAARALKQRGEKNGVEDLAILHYQKLHELEPNLSEQAIGALYVPTGAIVCPYELTVAAMGSAIDNGVEFKRLFAVTAIEDRGDHFVLSSASTDVSARYVVNAAGVYGDKIAAMVGDAHIHIRPRRGQYLLLDKEVGNLVDHTIFQIPSKFGKGILVTPTVDGNLMVGPTAENIDDKEDKAMTAEGMALVIEKAKKTLPSLPLQAVITSFAGLRAISDTDDFVIEPSKQRHRILHVAGIASPGLASSPAIAAYAVKCLGEMGVTLQKKANFEPSYRHTPRLRRLSNEERAAYIARDSRYGRIVCRCEEISEGEIVDAIHRAPGAVDCDGVKRRVRCGMGRCQGGFCLPTVADILSRELNIPLEQVTKSGAGSELLTGKTK